MKKSFGAKTLIYPTPVWCVGSYDTDGNPNVMTIAWGGICCSQPPCVTISLRKATFTYGNIMARQAYTLRVPSVKHIRDADFFGMFLKGKGDRHPYTTWQESPRLPVSPSPRPFIFWAAMSAWARGNVP